MKTRRIALAAALAFAAISVLAIARPEPVRADAPIYQALTSLRGLTDQSFEKVVTWARNGASSVFMPSRDYENAEAAIRALPSNDREAILQWLRGNGRGALYALGVSDNYIGARRPGADFPAATPTPDAWRQIQFATDTFSDTPSGPIQVASGLAAARRDGTNILACVTFTNTAPQTATSISFTFTMKDANGGTVGNLRLVRTGTFSTGIGIHTWDSYTSWRQQSGNRGYNDNCVTKETGVPALPILEARYVTYTVRSVTFADGTTWNAAGGNGP